MEGGTAMEYPRKRARSRSPSPSSAPQDTEVRLSPSYVHDAEYYLDDGNVVIAVQNTVFRVHRSVLSMHSDVFRDMFAVSQATTAETLDGCPLIHLQEDARMFGKMIDTFYRGTTSDYANPRATWTVTELCGLLELGYKYYVESLRNMAITRIKTMLPSESAYRWVPIHKGMRNARVIFELEDNEQPGRGLSLDTECVMLTHLIEQIRKFDDLAHNLPIALYAFSQALHSASIINNGRAIISSLLSSTSMVDDGITCLQAIPTLFSHRDFICNSIFDPAMREGCTDKTKCADALLHIAFKLASNREFAHVDYPDPLDLDKYAAGILTESDLGESLCSSCCKKIIAEILRRRRSTWKFLGLWFQLPEWQPMDGGD
ncbi:hypothetical protein BC629DRAFT_1592496 [Irpex lacteus]|nr:hypothetical protein BC629DRAFT_1592496 [Irpex lacteus]